MKYILECMDKQVDGVSSMVLTEYHNPTILMSEPEIDIDAAEDDDVDVEEPLPEPAVPPQLQPQIQIPIIINKQK